MKRYILTGAPGAGKTAILRAMQLRSYPVVEEAATDIVASAQARGDAQPWISPGFIDDIVELQRRRQERPAPRAAVQIFDRSPVCALALARFLGWRVSDPLAKELRRIEQQAVYERRVFFVESLGFMTNTDVRRISLEEARRFGEVHQTAYRELGYDLVPIAPASVADRTEAVVGLVETWGV